MTASLDDIFARERRPLWGLCYRMTGSAADAEQRVRDGDFDAVLLDLMLPDGDGMEVCKAIRRFSQVPILMITARVEEVDRLLGLEIGADDYVPKPFHLRELLARVRTVLRRRDRSVAAVAAAGEATVLRFAG